MSQFNLPLIQTYLDIETDGTSAGCNVWEIGIAMYVDSKPFIEHEALIKPQGGRYDPATIEWLKSHGLYEKYLSSDHEGEYLADFLTDFKAKADLVKNFPHAAENYDYSEDRTPNTVYTWGNFDIGILEAACKLPYTKNPKVGVDFSKPSLPWHYGAGCSLRDVHKYHELPNDFRPDTSEHVALSDAKALRKFHVKLHVEIVSAVMY